MTSTGGEVVDDVRDYSIHARTKEVNSCWWRADGAAIPREMSDLI
jgi:hypothetical protein